MDHRVLEIGHVDLFDQADDYTRPPNLVTGLESAVGAIGEIGQNRAPLALGDRHASEDPTWRGGDPGEDIGQLTILVAADVNHEAPTLGGDAPQVRRGTDNQMGFCRVSLDHQQRGDGETRAIRPGPGSDNGHPGGKPPSKPACQVPIYRIGLERVLGMDHGRTLGKAVPRRPCFSPEGGSSAEGWGGGSLGHLPNVKRTT